MDEAGQYPTGKVGVARDWDGHAWASEPVTDPAAPALPPGGHFVLRTLPFWIAAAAVVAGAVLAGVAADEVSPNRPLFGVAGLISCGGVLIAMTVAIWRRLRISAAIRGVGSRPATIVGLGIASGVVAFVVAFFVELGSAALGAGVIGVLFLAGPIEETAKLALPVIIFYATRKRWGDPRVAFGLAWLSGAVFGIVEGGRYLVGAPHAELASFDAMLFNEVHAVALAINRPFVEMLHPLLTGAAAAAMWLGAWRGRRLLVGAGLTAFLTSVAMHSFNDGVINGLLALATSPLVASALWPLWLVAVYQVFRLRARELVPPSMIARSQPRWRPHVRASAAALAPAPAPPVPADQGLV